MLVSLPVGDQIQDIFRYGTQPNSLGNLIGNVIDVILIAALLIFLFFLIIGGVNWITSEGKPDNVEKARNQITHAFIGLAITLGAWAIWVLVQYFFGVDL